MDEVVVVVLVMMMVVAVVFVEEMEHMGGDAIPTAQRVSGRRVTRDARQHAPVRRADDGFELHKQLTSFNTELDRRLPNIPYNALVQW
jgi:hypothetical protein